MSSSAGRFDTCTDCGVYQRIYGRDRCRKCYRAWHAKQPGVREYHAKYMNEWRKKNPERAKATERKRQQTPKRQAWCARYNREYYRANREHLKEYQRGYRQRRNRDDPGWQSEYKRRYRARKQGLEVALMAGEWESILEQCHHMCIYCGNTVDKLVREHWIPVSRGGPYTAANIVPACSRCNSRKGTMTGDEFLDLLDLEEWGLISTLIEEHCSESVDGSVQR